VLPIATPVAFMTILRATFTDNSIGDNDIKQIGGFRVTVTAIEVLLEKVPFDTVKIIDRVDSALTLFASIIMTLEAKKNLKGQSEVN